MDPFFVERVPKHLVKQMVEKFKTGAEGGAFYRCNKFAENFVEKVKPVWPLPNSTIFYSSGMPRYVYGMKVVKEAILNEGAREGLTGRKNCGSRNGLSNAPLQFCKIGEVAILDAKPKYCKRVILPELKAIGAIELLTLAPKLPELTPKLPDNVVRDLLEAAKPKRLEFADSDYDATSESFNDIEHLEIRVEDEDETRHRATEVIFQLSQNRKTLTFFLGWDIFSEGVVKTFIKDWLRWRPTGTLEKLIFRIDADAATTEHVNAQLEDVNKNLMIRCEQTATGYIIEGQRGILQMDVDFDDYYDYITFTFP